MSHVPSIDALALPANFPRVGDHLHKLYAAVPPSPYKPFSSLHPMRVDAEDIKFFSARKDHSESRNGTLPQIPQASPRQGGGGTTTEHGMSSASPQKWGQTTYRRFFDVPQVSTLLNDPKAYRQGKVRMERGSGDILGGFLHESEDVGPPSDSNGSSRRSTNVKRQQQQVQPSTPIPPPPPPISYAERMVAQAAVEEARLMQRISERKQMAASGSNSGRHDGSVSPRRGGESSSRQPTLDAGSLKNLFLVPSRDWEPEQGTPTAELSVASARNKIRQQLQLTSPRR